jgi:hypothetical protein
MLFTGKQMELEDIMLSDKGHMFSHMWKIDSKVNVYIHKDKHDHIHIYI